MSYLDKILQPGETVLGAGRLHWIVYSRPLLMLALGLLLLAVWASGVYSDGGDTDAGSLFEVAALALIVLAFLAFVPVWIRRLTTEIVVTDRRVIYKRGLVARRTVEMNMAKVETVDVSQSILGRLLNYGSILIRGTGSTYEPLTNVADPLRLRSFIVAQ